MLKVALVGRPNVGKSTLFNRLCGRRAAITHDMPGVTRDWQEHPARIGHFRFTIIDTPGLSQSKKETLEHRMTGKASEAIDRADAVVFMVDGKEGMHPDDKEFSKWLRKFGKQVILLANKCENEKEADFAKFEFRKLGFDEAIPVSASHNVGMSDLLEELEKTAKRLGSEQPDIKGTTRRERAEIKAQKEVDVFEGMEDLPEMEEEDSTDQTIYVAIVGRPNAGKSTLVNTIIGSERLLTGPEAGITRDSINVEWEYHGTRLKLVDTAGLRRKAKVDKSLEKMANSSSIHNIKFAQVVVVVIDAEHPLENQDLSIAELAEKGGRAVVVCINKADLIKDEKAYSRAIDELIKTCLPQLKGLPVVKISAIRNRNIDKLLQAIIEIHKTWCSRVKTSELNDWLADAVMNNPPPAIKGKRIRLKFASQIKTRPPTIAMFTNQPEKLPQSYERYLINSFRENFKMPGTPVRITLKKSANPFKKK